MKDITNLYFDFHQGKNFNDFLIKNKEKIGNYDIINFINFGIVNKIFKRLHGYPINFKKTKNINFNFESDPDTSLLNLSNDEIKK